MGYTLHAFICTQHEAKLFSDHFSHSANIHLAQDLCLIPMTEQLYDQINNLQVSDSVGKFSYLTNHVETKVLEIIGNRKFAYVEADYFGGEGGQIGIIWNTHKRESLFEYGQDCINKVLQNFGVVAAAGSDEFETLSLGRYRNTIDWI